MGKPERADLGGAWDAGQGVTGGRRTGTCWAVGAPRRRVHGLHKCSLAPLRGGRERLPHLIRVLCVPHTPLAQAPGRGGDGVFPSPKPQGARRGAGALLSPRDPAPVPAPGRTCTGSELCLFQLRLSSALGCSETPSRFALLSKGCAPNYRNHAIIAGSVYRNRAIITGHTASPQKVSGSLLFQQLLHKLSWLFFSVSALWAVGGRGLFLQSP